MSVAQNRNVSSNFSPSAHPLVRTPLDSGIEKHLTIAGEHWRKGRNAGDSESESARERNSPRFDWEENLSDRERARERGAQRGKSGVDFVRGICDNDVLITVVTSSRKMGEEITSIPPTSKVFSFFYCLTCHLP